MSRALTGGYLAGSLTVGTPLSSPGGGTFRDQSQGRRNGLTGVRLVIDVTGSFQWDLAPREGSRAGRRGLRHPCRQSVSGIGAQSDQTRRARVAAVSDFLDWFGSNFKNDDGEVCNGM